MRVCMYVSVCLCVRVSVCVYICMDRIYVFFSSLVFKFQSACLFLREARVCVCVCVFVCLFACTEIYVILSFYFSIGIYTPVCICVRISVCLCVCANACVCVRYYDLLVFSLALLKWKHMNIIAFYSRANCKQIFHLNNH